MQQQQIIIQASRIISIENMINRTFEEVQAKTFYVNNKDLFDARFVYIFDVNNGRVKWEINKRLVDFKILIKTLANKKGYSVMAAFGTQSQNPDQQLLARLEHYLKNALQQPTIKEQIYEFIEETGHSYQGVQKYREIHMLKKPGGRFSQYCAKCTSKMGIWRNRYFIIHNQGIIYKDQKNNARQYLIYDFDFKINYGKSATGDSLGIIIKSTQRQLRLRADNIFDFIEFIYYVKLGIKNSEYVTMNRYGSYAPQRTNCTVEFFIDGQEYYFHLAHEMLKATKDIYITGWWISPEFYLIRPVNQQNKRFRLDRILKQVAEKGVNIRILIYHQPKVLTINSAYTKSTLQKLSPNIKVIRHPIGVLQLLWSHHEKMVIIDQSIGFLGGLDICYGRFDSTSHKLFDQDTMYPGIDYNNMRMYDFQNVHEFQKQHFSRQKPMLPWHDVSLQAKGPVVWDMSRHFIQYWNYASFQVEQNQRQIISQQHGVLRRQFNKLQKQLQKGFQKFKDVATNLKNKIWNKDQPSPGRYPQNIGSTTVFDNYINIVKDNSDIDTYRFVQLNTNTQLIKGNDSSQKQQIQSSHRINDPLKKQYIEILDNVKKTRRQDTNQQIGQPRDKRNQLARTYSFRNSLAVTGRYSLTNEIKNWTFECQMVRSVGQWSIGCASSSTEPSIQLAYIELISNSKHYIYIQNQFFISSYADPNVVKNQIVHALALRILKAYQNHEEFKVYVMLPLLPGFAGQVDDPNAKVLRLQMYWQYQTISRSKTSLLTQLSNHIPDPYRYIKFIGARTHDRLNQKSYPQTQIIYIHSKLMIVDDEYAICGSANINDRSMRGKRDSQLCMVCRDTDTIICKMGNSSIKVSKRIQNLRRRLFQQHFGFVSDDDINPSSDYTWNLINVIVRQNTEIYRKIFACYPDDNVHTFNQLSDFKKMKNLQLYEQLKHKIKGHAVDFPLNFLLKQNLSLKRMQKQSFLPVEFAT